PPSEPGRASVIIVIDPVKIVLIVGHDPGPLPERPESQGMGLRYETGLASQECHSEHNRQQQLLLHVMIPPAKKNSRVTLLFQGNPAVFC
ncbi:MAG: hypothetical protein ACOC3A_03505, partial [Thermodesulfobacteriota bacterium]